MASGGILAIKHLRHPHRACLAAAPPPVRTRPRPGLAGTGGPGTADTGGPGLAGARDAGWSRIAHALPPRRRRQPGLAGTRDAESPRIAHAWPPSASRMPGCRRAAGAHAPSAREPLAPATREPFAPTTREPFAPTTRGPLTPANAAASLTVIPPAREQEQLDLLLGVHANLRSGHRRGVQLFVRSPVRNCFWEKRPRLVYMRANGL